MFEAIFNALWNSMREALSNQLVGGGLVLMAIGTVGALCRRVPFQLWALAKRQFIVSFEVMNNDPIFHWLSVWLNEQSFTTRVRDVTASVRRTYWGEAMPELGTDTGPQVIFTPAPGTHWFWYQGRLVWLTRERQEAKPGERGGLSSLNMPEKFYLRVVGRNQRTLRNLIEDARGKFAKQTAARVSVFVSGYGGWRKVADYKPRPLASVILPDGLKEELVSDVQEFLDSREWYQSRGVPWRRGYLFHGTPGSGKSSLIAAMAGDIKFDLYALNVAGSGMTDEQLMQLLLEVPARSAVLFEDISDVVKGREVKNVGEGLTASAVTFSGLINALDGVTTKEGLLIFMTTNHVMQLDRTLIRPGRVDLPVKFTHATTSQIRLMFQHFYEAPDESMAVRFADAVMPRCVTMAEVQQHLLNYKKSPHEALSHSDEVGSFALTEEAA